MSKASDQISGWCSIFTRGRGREEERTGERRREKRRQERRKDGRKKNRWKEETILSKEVCFGLLPYFKIISSWEERRLKEM